MSTLTIEISDDLAGWLNDRAAKTGLTEEQVVRAQLEQARVASVEKPWMKYVGCIDGPPDLSQRKGYSRG